MPFADDRDTEKGYIELIGEIAGTLIYWTFTVLIESFASVLIKKVGKYRRGSND